MPASFVNDLLVFSILQKRSQGQILRGARQNLCWGVSSNVETFVVCSDQYSSSQLSQLDRTETFGTWQKFQVRRSSCSRLFPRDWRIKHPRSKGNDVDIIVVFDIIRKNLGASCDECTRIFSRLVYGAGLLITPDYPV
jgi:hypothetical protein